MTITRIVGLLLLAVGLVLLVLGYRATGSLGETARQEFTGRYSAETVWLLVLGVAGVAVGGALALFGRAKAPRQGGG